MSSTGFSSPKRVPSLGLSRRSLSLGSLKMPEPPLQQIPRLRTRRRSSLEHPIAGNAGSMAASFMEGSSVTRIPERFTHVRERRQSTNANTSTSTPLGRALERQRRLASGRESHNQDQTNEHFSAQRQPIEPASAHQLLHELPSHASAGSEAAVGLLPVLPDINNTGAGGGNDGSGGNVSIVGREALWLEPDFDPSGGGGGGGSRTGTAAAAAATADAAADAGQQQQQQQLPGPMWSSPDRSRYTSVGADAVAEVLETPAPDVQRFNVRAGFRASDNVKMEIMLEELVDPLSELSDRTVHHAAHAAYDSPTHGMVQIVLIGTDGGLFVYLPGDNTAVSRPATSTRTSSSMPSSSYGRDGGGGGNGHGLLRNDRGRRLVLVEQDPCEWVCAIGTDGTAVSILRAGTSGKPSVCLHTLSSVVDHAISNPQQQQGQHGAAADASGPRSGAAVISAPVPLFQGTSYAYCTATNSAFDASGDFYLCVAIEFRLVLLVWDLSSREFVTLRDFDTPFSEPPPAVSKLLFMQEQGQLPQFCVGCSCHTDTRATQLALIDFNLLPAVAQANMNPDLGWLCVNYGWEDVFATSIEQLCHDVFALCCANAVSFVQSDGRSVTAPNNPGARGSGDGGGAGESCISTGTQIVFSELPESFVFVPGAVLGVSPTGVEVRSLQNGNVLGHVAGRFVSTWPEDLGTCIWSSASRAADAVAAAAWGAGGRSKMTSQTEWMQYFTDAMFFSGVASTTSVRSSHILGLMATEVSAGPSHARRQASTAGRSSNAPQSVELHVVQWEFEDRTPTLMRPSSFGMVHNRSPGRDTLTAQRKLGSAYRYGKGVQQDKAEALKWFKLAAEKGDAKAQYYLSIMYKNAEGVNQDYNAAFKWCKLAADSVQVDAMRLLGFMYMLGHGVAQDTSQSVCYWQLAAEIGDAGSIKALTELQQGNIIPTPPPSTHVTVLLLISAADAAKYNNKKGVVVAAPSPAMVRPGIAFVLLDGEDEQATMFKLMNLRIDV